MRELKMNIAVFCSGNGSNFQAIADAAKNRYFDANIAVMICDKKGASAIERAKKANIKTAVIPAEEFCSTEEFEKEIIKTLEQDKIGLICLAGFMRILSPAFISKYSSRIINVHPSLLPSFKGTQGIKDAFDYGVKVTGVTIHFVTEDLDAGPIILQKEINIEEGDMLETLEEKIHKTEHELYPEAIKLFVEGKLEIIGRKVRIKQ